MRIRTIKPDFWEHPVMGRKSDATKLLAIGLLNIADDEGYFYADAKLIRNAVRPFDDDSGIVTVSIRELSEIGYVSIKKHPTHGDIGKVESFLDHQVINKPKKSKLKHLYESSSDTVLIPDEDRLERKGKEVNGKDILSKKLDDMKLAESIYEWYPRKEGKKKGVEAIIKAMSKHSHEFLLERTQTYAATYGSWKERQFIPLPATWFNGERFNDDQKLWEMPCKSEMTSVAQMGLSGMNSAAGMNV